MKYILLALLVFAIASIGVVTVNDAYGQNSSEDTDPEIPGHKQLSPKSFGSKNTQVCGDRLC